MVDIMLIGLPLLVILCKERSDMFKRLDVVSQLAKAQQKEDILTQGVEKARADIDYIAMMTDVDIDTEEPETEVNDA